MACGILIALAPAVEGYGSTGKVCSFSDVFPADTATTAFFAKGCRTIDLSNSNIEVKEVKAIADLLVDNTYLTELFLNGNNIGNSGAVMIAGALMFNAALTNLRLGYNGIGDSGAIAIAEALKVNTTALTALDLRGNMVTFATMGDVRIGDSGVAAIAEALENNTVLKSLHLGTNSFGNSGAVAIAEALKVNTALTTLSLIDNYNTDRNSTCETVAITLADALQYNSVLQTLGLDACISERTRLRIVSSLVDGYGPCRGKYFDSLGQWEESDCARSGASCLTASFNTHGGGLLLLLLLLL